MPQRPARHPFISVNTDAIQNEFLLYQDRENVLPLGARIAAGHRLISTAAREFAKLGKKKLSVQLLEFIKAYKAPRFSSTVAVTSDEIPVRRFGFAGITESTADIALTDDPKPILDRLIDQMHQTYYHTQLALVVSGVMIELAEAGIIPSEVEQLQLSFEHLKGDEGKDDSLEYAEDDRNSDSKEDDGGLDDLDEPAADELEDGPLDGEEDDDGED